MSIRVITSVVATRPGIRPWRVVATLLGWLLTVSGLLVAIPMVALLAASLALAQPARDLGTLVLFLAIGAAAVFIGRRLVRGKRRLILFLRRFGFAGSSKALSFAVGTAIGRRFRAVTLDDAELAPVGTRRWARWTLAVASVVSIFVLVAVVGEFASWFTGDEVGDLFTGTFENARKQAAERGDNVIGAFIGSIFVALIVTLVIGAMVMAILTIFLAVAGASAAMSASSWFGVMRAEFGKRRTVRRSSDIEHATGKVVKRARGIFAPRMVVLKSASDVWRETVSRLAGAADILLIDVSVPSDNLLWEISTIRAEQRRRWILIGQRDRIAELVARAGTANRGLDGTLAGLLDGEEILTYDSTSRQALSQFARSLRTMCQNIADRAA